MQSIALIGPARRSTGGIHSLYVKPFVAYDPMQRKLRLGRIIWERGEWGMKTPDGKCIPYSFMLTLALRPALFSFRREYDQTRLTVLGVSVNYHHSAGGRFAP